MKIEYYKITKAGNSPSILFINDLDDFQNADPHTYCCADMHRQIDSGFIEIAKSDPPELHFKDSKVVAIVRFCPNCGEKVEVVRILEPKSIENFINKLEGFKI